MKILKQGHKHEAKAWFTTCHICESELRIIEGDPHATPEVCYNCDACQYYIRYICPVCNSMNRAYTDSSFATEKGNAIYKTIVLDEEDREEVKGFDKARKLNDEELRFINNRSRV